MLVSQKRPRLFRRIFPPVGKPIFLHYKCDHVETNDRPYPLTERQRAIAQEQAKRTVCDQCNPQMWAAMRSGTGLPELTAAGSRVPYIVWDEIPLLNRLP